MIYQALMCQFRAAAIALLFLIGPLLLHAQNNPDFKPLTADNVMVD